MGDEIFFKDGKAFKKSSGLSSLLFPAEELGELQDEWTGGQKVVDGWGNTIVRVEREPLCGDAKARVGDQTGVITEPGYWDGDLAGTKVFRPDRTVEDASTADRITTTSSIGDWSHGGDCAGLTGSFGSGKSAPQKTLIIVGRFVAAGLAAVVTGVITFFLSMIVVGLFFHLVMGLDSLTGWTFMVFVLGWLLPPVWVFILVSGIAQSVISRRNL